MCSLQKKSMNVSQVCLSDNVNFIIIPCCHLCLVRCCGRFGALSLSCIICAVRLVSACNAVRSVCARIRRYPGRRPQRVSRVSSTGRYLACMATE